MMGDVAAQTAHHALDLTGKTMLVASLMMEAGGRDMDQPLEKIPLPGRGAMPSMLPRLMAVEETARVEQPGAFLEEGLQTRFAKESLGGAPWLRLRLRLRLPDAHERGQCAPLDETTFDGRPCRAPRDSLSCVRKGPPALEDPHVFI